MHCLHGWLHPEAAAGGGRLPDPVTAALPLFFVLIAVELLAASRLPGGISRIYNLRQSMSNVAAGTLTVVLGVFTKALHIVPYIWLHRHLGLLPWAPHNSWAVNALAFLVCDCGFYWQHRCMHASNLGWAAHVVHHSSPDFNLTTALRQGAGESTFGWLFYLPMALFCPPDIYALHRGLNTVYQFFTHTQLVDRLWLPLELVLNTPSHHRVHHARNYGRRNFAGVLIVWDRLFGTFEEEQPARACIYGLDAQPKVQGTYNPLWHQAHHALATLRLLTAGSVPAWRALFTRAAGPGMVSPAVTDAADVQPSATGGAAASDVQAPISAASAAPVSGSAQETAAAAAMTPAAAAAAAAHLSEGGASNSSDMAGADGLPACSSSCVPGAAVSPAASSSELCARQQQGPGQAVNGTGGGEGEIVKQGAGAPQQQQQQQHEQWKCAVEGAGGGGAVDGGAAFYPWERRPLGVLDYYAAAHFFGIAVPAANIFLVGVGGGQLSPLAILAGAAFTTWTFTTLAWLCGGEVVAVEHELARLVAQKLLAEGLLRWGALPPPAGAPLARAIQALSVTSFIFLLRHLMARGAVPAGGLVGARLAAAAGGGGGHDARQLAAVQEIKKAA